MPDSSSGPTETTQKVEPWEKAKPHLERIYGIASDMYDSGGITPYPGSTVADRSEATIMAQDLAMQQALGPMTAMANAAGQATTNAFNAPDVANNPYVQNMKNVTFDAMNRDFNRSVAPGIRDQAFAHGQLGQEGHGQAYGLGLDALTNAKGQYAAQVDADAYGKGLTAQANALEFSPRAMASMGMPASVLEGIGQSQDAYEQRLVNEQINKYNANQLQPYDNLNQYAAIVSGSPWGSTSAMSGGGGGGGLLGGIGGASAGAGIASALGLTGPVGWGLTGLGALGGYWDD